MSKTLAVMLVFFLSLSTNSEAKLRVTKSTPQERVYFVEGDLKKHVFKRLLVDLRTAGPKEKIHIVINNNSGGIDYVAEPILRAVQRSKAQVTTESRRWVASYAAVILMAGPTVKISHSSRIGWHYKYYPLPGGRKHVLIEESEYQDRNLKFIWKKHEVEKMRKGGLIILTGKELCARLKSRMIKSTGSYCIARGVAIPYYN